MNTNAIAKPQPEVGQRYFDNSDGTVTDTVCNLMWSKATLCDEEVDQREAARICSSLDLGGHSDWRLPTDHELLSIADRTRYAPAIDTEAFPDTKSDWYWTSTEYKGDSSVAWFVDFNSGSSSYYRRDYSDAFVRAVRSLPPGQ
ncbi:DUF1566 domain-containing protein [Lysobacter enzymogenes]|uniref:Lcl C-terminal domain-containing protein n=1 Tax=Lysobacter enzymogenes TaxID=69 RepID=UPI00099D8994|nr:DUF1566 domain-containing protein [Lysobacter enzymogenes]UZW62723.1 DUF1566 domain-containing protein [Lysobacter enzymogenes]